MKDKVIPSLVLTLIAVTVCGLLVLANALTKDKIAKAQEDKINSSLSETFGDTDYEVLGSFKAEGISNTFIGGNGKTVFELTESGYSKDGLHLLIGFDENDKLCGIGFLELSETPGLGTKVRDDKSFTEQFIGKSEKPDKFEKVTGATFSSNGMKKAVDKAYDAYAEYKKHKEGGDAK